MPTSAAATARSRLQPTRGSRKAGIPRNYITTWHSAAAARPLVRRPVTACVSCRAAKVKCDGQTECARCSERGVDCSYTTAATTNTTQPPHPCPQSQENPMDIDDGNLLSDASSKSTTSSAHDSLSLSASGTSTSASTNSPFPFTLESADVQGVDGFDSMAGWTLDAARNHHSHEQSRRPGDLDWAALDVDLFAFPHVSMPDNAVNDATTTTTTTTTTAARHDTTIITSDPAVPPTSLSFPFQLFSSSRCQCRENLAALVPRVANAMNEHRLDDIFRSTGDVLRGCRDVVGCTACRISCTDLICTMSVLQHTNTCFRYIANADLDSAITMSFGGSELPVNDPKLRAMLVMNLIHEATMVLDAISTKGQTMLRNLCPPGPLAQANIGYLDTVIRDFRVVLRLVADQVDKSGTRSTVLQRNNRPQAISP